MARGKKPVIQAELSRGQEHGWKIQEPKDQMLGPGSVLGDPGHNPILQVRAEGPHHSTQKEDTPFSASLGCYNLGGPCPGTGYLMLPQPQDVPSSGLLMLGFGLSEGSNPAPAALHRWGLENYNSINFTCNLVNLLCLRQSGVTQGPQTHYATRVVLNS